MPRVFRLLSRVASLAALSLVAFGASPAQAELPERLLPERLQRLLEQTPARPLATYLELTPEQSRTVPIYAAAEPLPIFLNRHGGTYYSAQQDDASRNHSTIVSGGSADVGAFKGTETEWQEVLSCIQDLFSRFHVVVTDVEPTSGTYVESVIGGRPQEIGMPFGVAGVAPFDPYGCRSIPNAIVYTFSDVYEGSPRFVREVCETAAQEIAHAFTLDHQMLCEDPMTYLSGCGNKSFQDEYATCGEYQPRECACNGPSQNSVQLLYERLGTHDGSPPPTPPSDAELPTVTLLSPENEATLPANSIMEIVADASDDVGLVAVELMWLFSNESMPCPGQGGSWSCTREGERHTWRVNVGQGMRTFRVRVRDVVGNVVNSAERSVWLSVDGSGPPADAHAPEVRIVSPKEGVPVPHEEHVRIVATASDDSGLAAVQLHWGESRVYPCPYDDGRSTCEQNGSTYVWEVRTRRAGTYSFMVSATDLLGNRTETPRRSLIVQPGAAPPSPLANDTFDLAAPLACGDSKTLFTEPGEEDWFAVDAPDGQRVVVEVDGEVADNLELKATTGPHSSEVFADAEGDPALSFTPPGTDEVHVRVRPRSKSGEYTITVECVPVEKKQPKPEEPGEVPFFGGCSHAPAGDSDTTPPSVAAVLGLMGLTFLRRRRR